MTALLSHMRPMNEILDPHLLDQRSAFEKQFSGMSTIPFTYEEFETTRNRLHINKLISENPKKHAELIMTLEKFLAPT